MNTPLSEQRQIENEMIFRRQNEKVADDLENLDELLEQDDSSDLTWDDSIPLDFKCECSDEDCDQRISMKVSAYKDIHADRDRFIIRPDHQVEEIEEVIATEDDYSVVKKNKTIAEPGNTLNDTAVNNT